MPKLQAVLSGDTNYKDLRKSNCVIMISVGQKYHEREKFESLIELINKKFKHCTIIVADSLQRHSIQIKSSDTSDEQAMSQAIENGDAWIQRNQKTIEKLTIPVQIVRWDALLQHDDFSNALATVSTDVTTSESYAHALDKDIGTYLSRIGYFKDNSGRPDPTCNAYKKTRDYLIEESAALIIMAKEEFSYHFIIYPNKLNQTLYNILQRYIHRENQQTGYEPYNRYLDYLIVNYKKYKEVITADSSDSSDIVTMFYSQGVKPHGFSPDPIKMLSGQTPSAMTIKVILDQIRILFSTGALNSEEKQNFIKTLLKVIVQAELTNLDDCSCTQPVNESTLGYQ